jgi:hypothetical protein
VLAGDGELGLEPGDDRVEGALLQRAVAGAAENHASRTSRALLLRWISRPLGLRRRDACLGRPPSAPDCPPLMPAPPRRSRRPRSIDALGGRPPQAHSGRRTRVPQADESGGASGASVPGRCCDRLRWCGSVTGSCSRRGCSTPAIRAPSTSPGVWRRIRRLEPEDARPCWSAKARPVPDRPGASRRDCHRVRDSEACGTACHASTVIATGGLLR